MKITNYPKVSKLSCNKCGAEFELNKFDLRRHKLFSDKQMGELCVKCPICQHEHYLSSFESNLLSLLYGKIYSIFENAAKEVKRNKQNYTKETAILLNQVTDDVLSQIYEEHELGEEIVVEEDDEGGLFDD